MLDLKANIFLYYLAIEALDHFITLSNVMYLLGFHSADELGIKEVDMNSARTLSRDYPFSWSTL